MKKALLAVLLLALSAGTALAQTHFPPVAGGTGDADPAQFSDPTGGLTIGGSAGAITISPNWSVVPAYAPGTGAVPGTGSVGTFYFKTDVPAMFTYPATDTEHWVLSIAPTSIAQGDIFYASSALTLARLGAGTSGQFLKTQGPAANPVWADAGSFDPSTTIDLYDDFIGGLASTGNIGSLGWNFSAIAGGTVSLGTMAQLGHPGLFRINAHATADDSGASIQLNPQAGTASAIGFSTLAVTDWTADFDILPGANGTAITTSSMWVGLVSTTTITTFSAGIFARYDTDQSDAVWKFVVCDSASAGCLQADDDTNIDVEPSTVAPLAGTFNRIRIRHTLTGGPGGVEMLGFRVGTETEKTFCSSGCSETINNMPVTGNAFLEFGYITRAPNNAISGEIDYAHLRISGLTR